MKVKSLSPVRLFATPWSVAYLAPLSMEFSSKSTRVGYHFLFQGIFPTQGSNPGLPHCRQTLYHLSHRGSHGLLQARILEWVALSLLQQIFPPQGLNQSLLHCRQILYQLSYQGSLWTRQTGTKSLCGSHPQMIGIESGWFPL